MKHIKTTSAEETAAKAAYKEVEDGEVTADKDTEAAARELLKVLEEIDKLSLHASKLKAALMKAMKNKLFLRAEDGTMLASWASGNTSEKIDYDGIMKKYKVTADDIAAFTKTTVGARRFTLEI